MHMHSNDDCAQYGKGLHETRTISVIKRTFRSGCVKAKLIDALRGDKLKERATYAGTRTKSQLRQAALP